MGENTSKGKGLVSIPVEAELKEKYVVEQQQKDLIELQIALGAETVAHLRADWEWNAQKKVAQNLKNHLNKPVQSQRALELQINSWGRCGEWIRVFQPWRKGGSP